MRDHETQRDGAQGAPPLKAKTGGEQGAARKQADGQTATHPDILGDGRASHPANAEPLAELLSQLQQSHGNAYVQRFVGESGGEKAHEAKPAAESHSLDAGVRSQMESAFGEEFGDVRVHAGQRAGEAAEELGARAFTRGRDIYFKEGEYNPSTQEGRELLAHELTHVVQQRGGSSSRGASVGPVGDTHEHEADEVAASVMRGERAHVERRSAAADVQRQQQQAPLPKPQELVIMHTLQLVENSTLYMSTDDFNVNIRLSSVPGANFDTLHVMVPARLSVTVVDLSGMDVQVQDPGGEAARAVVIRANRRAGMRLLQLTFTKGNKVYVRAFQLPTVSPAAAVTAGAAAGEAGKKK